MVVPDGLWTDLCVVAETGSTNADVAAAARAGAAEGLVVVAELQTSGRGRLGRVWQSPPRAGIAVSVLLRPAVPAVRLGWLPLLAGVALTEAVRRVSEVDAVLKWPNDLLVRHNGAERKCAGILVESLAEGGVVLGIGLNTTLREHELPHPDATSLALAGAACVDRDPLLRAILRSVEQWYDRWRRHAGDPDASGLRAAYAFHCGTLGRQVEVRLPGDRLLRGRAEEIDTEGRLVVDAEPGGTGRVAVAAGDVVHLR